MPFADLESVDLFAIVITLLFLLGVLVYFLLKYSNMKNCSIIVKKGRTLFWWRVNLYSAVVITWLIAYLTFANPFVGRFIFYPFFIFSTSYAMIASLPAYLCKLNKQIGTCLCDAYEYNDFAPMLVLGSLGNLIFAIFNWSQISGLLFIALLGILAYLIAMYIPKKVKKVHNIPEEILIRTADEYQQFIMVEPSSSKLVIVVGNSCKFCDEQVNSINLLPKKFIHDNIRVLDISDPKNIDQMILFTLNLDDSLNFPIPISFEIKNGMCIDQRGFLTTEEMQYFLMK